MTALFAARDDYGLSRTLILIRGSGYTALVLLAASLAVTPLSKIRATLAPQRRKFGLAAAAMGLIHAVLTLASDWIADPVLLIYEPQLRNGAAALAILAALAATSFPKYFLKVRRWKELHYLAYAAAVLALAHLALAPLAPARAVWIAAGILLLLAGARIALWIIARARPARRDQ